MDSSTTHVLHILVSLSLSLSSLITAALNAVTLYSIHYHRITHCSHSLSNRINTLPMGEISSSGVMHRFLKRGANYRTQAGREWSNPDDWTRLLFADSLDKHV
jgi:hypothetical protein